MIVKKVLFTLAMFLLVAFSTANASQLKAFDLIMDDGHSIKVYNRIAENPQSVILLIHGRTWSAIPDFDLVTPSENLSMMQAFASRNMAVYAVDMRGYGKTLRDKSGWLTPNRAAKDVANVLDEINKRHPSLNGTSIFGWSYGSMIAMLTAQQNPDKVKSIILYGFPTDTDFVYKNGPKDEKPLRKATSKNAAAEDFILPGTISKEAINAYVEAAVKADPVRMDWNQLAQWNALDGSKVSVPTLLLQADSDPYVNWDADAELFKDLANKNKQWVVLANADHAALLESARFRLYDAVVNFINWIDK